MAPKATTRKRKAADDAAPAKAKKAKGSASGSTIKEPSTRKRKAADDTAAPAAKKVKALTKGETINEPPTQPLNVYVFGEGSAGELGLGTAKNAVDVKRPRLNPNLAADKVGVTQVEG